MAIFNVRVFGYRGMRQIPHLNNVQYTSDTVYALEEPYEWSDVVSVNGATMTPVTIIAPANDKSKILRIEVADNAQIRFEINPPGRAVAAGNKSPRMSGIDVYPWSPGYSFNCVDAASFL